MIVWAIAGSISKHTIDVLPRLFVDRQSYNCGCRNVTIGASFIVFHVELSVTRVNAVCGPKYQALLAKARNRTP